MNGKPMKALGGPFEGKLYLGVPKETKTLIDNYRTFYEFYLVTYERTSKGWKFVKEEVMFQSASNVALGKEEL